MKGVQCYELFGGIALKINTFSFFSFSFSGISLSARSPSALSLHDISVDTTSLQDDILNNKSSFLSP